MRMSGFRLLLWSLSSLAAHALQDLTWTQLADGPWSAREGLMAVTSPEGIYLSGGRDRLGATAIRDVWFSSNGSSWTQKPTPPWPARSYHAMYSQDGCIVVAGGQKVSFVGNPYFNDVWKSCDGAFGSHCPVLAMRHETCCDVRFARGADLAIAGQCSLDNSGRNCVHPVRREDGRRGRMLRREWPLWSRPKVPKRCVDLC